MAETWKVLSLINPWSSFVAEGFKVWETRSYGIRYRGPLLIHASKTSIVMPPDVARVYSETGMDNLPTAHVFGAIVAKAYITEVRDINVSRVIPAGDNGVRLYGDDDEPLKIGLLEYLLGDYAPGRKAWRLEQVQPLAVPVPASGKLGLWDWTGELPEVRRGK